jgi:hypothetical protein
MENGTNTMVSSHFKTLYPTNAISDSSVSSRKEVCTPAAYLLFYRRRSSHPLGSPEIQKIVERAMGTASADSEGDTSGSNSPAEHDKHIEKSGNGRRLGDSYPNGNGSSSALVGPAAARPLHGVGLAGQGPQASGSGTGTSRMMGVQGGQGAQSRGILAKAAAGAVAKFGGVGQGLDVDSEELGEIHNSEEENVDRKGKKRPGKLQLRSGELGTAGGGYGGFDEGIGLDEDDEHMQGDPFEFPANMYGNSWSFRQLGADSDEESGPDQNPMHRHPLHQGLIGRGAHVEAEGEDFASDVAEGVTSDDEDDAFPVFGDMDPHGRDVDGDEDLPDYPGTGILSTANPMYGSLTSAGRNNSPEIDEDEGFEGDDDDEQDHGHGGVKIRQSIERDEHVHHVPSGEDDDDSEETPAPAHLKKD